MAKINLGLGSCLRKIASQRIPIIVTSWEELGTDPFLLKRIITGDSRESVFVSSTKFRFLRYKKSKSTRDFLIDPLVYVWKINSNSYSSFLLKNSFGSSPFSALLFLNWLLRPFRCSPLCLFSLNCLFLLFIFIPPTQNFY